MEIKTDFLAYFHHGKRIVMYTKKTGLYLRLIANNPVFKFNDYFSMIASVAVKFSSEPDFV